jgi:stage II sporulation protein D
MKSTLFPAVMFLFAALLSGCSRESARISPQYREMAPSGISSGVILGVVVAEGKDAKVSPSKKYRGTLETITENGKTMVVNRVAVDDYVKGVMNGEVSPAWPPEALKAMAIVIRSYAYNRWAASNSAKAHMYSDVRSQEYCGINCEDIRSNAAVDDTAGLVMVHNNQVLQAFSHACCAGTTETASEVWGSSEDGECFQVKNCQWCRGSKHFGPWMLIMEKTTLSRRLAPDIGKGLTLKTITVIDRNESGRVRTVEVQTIWKKVRMSGAHFRSLVGWNDIRSARFEVEDRGDVMQFEGTGWGHGVGLCQEGTRKMAEEGTDAETILKFYFPGVEVWHLPR